MTIVERRAGDASAVAQYALLLRADVIESAAAIIPPMLFPANNIKPLRRADAAQRQSPR